MMKGLDLAKYILQNSSERLSNLELQKTMYFAELDYYKTKKKHLLDGDFEAWQYGPVVPDVYWEYRNYGASFIDRPKETISVSDEDKKIINASIERSNGKESWDLVKESHREDGAWRETINAKRAIIDKELIQKEAEKYGNNDN
ncbi:MAG: DUF4065 domain-containing protein [Helicobacter sp.]|nr:DUF4065 domain-containing protein [Helicobacter sp.]